MSEVKTKSDQTQASVPPTKDDPIQSQGEQTQAQAEQNELHALHSTLLETMDAVKEFHKRTGKRHIDQGAFIFLLASEGMNGKSDKFEVRLAGHMVDMAMGIEALHRRDPELCNSLFTALRIAGTNPSETEQMLIAMEFLVHAKRRKKAFGL